MGQMTHRIMFTIVSAIGGILFLTAFLFQFSFLPTIITQEFVRWTAPFGLGLIIIGLTGLFITSKRHQMKKLKEMDVVEEDEGLDGAPPQEGQRFQDYITSPEEGITVYTLFLAGVVIIVWGFFMLFRWIRVLIAAA